MALKHGTDAAGKTRHSVVMLLCGPVLADNAPELAQQRAFARYTFLWADSALHWSRQWRNQMAGSGDPTAVKHAGRMKKEVQAFASLLDRADGVRDYLVAKRQPLDASRADDIDKTAAMWDLVNPATVNELWLGAARLYDALSARAGSRSIIEYAALPFTVQNAIRASLPVREEYWYLATDTGADQRPHTLPAAQGGELGRLIAQINDVAIYLDALLRVAPLLQGLLPYDWFVRSALLLELSTLLDLAFGRPGQLGLLNHCEYGRPKAEASDLRNLRDSIAPETRRYIRWCRDKFGAHVDARLPLWHLHDHLAQLDYQGIIHAAEHMLNFLDELGANSLDLKMLLMGERRIASWPLRPKPGSVPPPVNGVPRGSLSSLFRTIDSPYMSGAASVLGSAILAGLSAGRKPEPRAATHIKSRWDPLLDPIAPAISISESSASSRRDPTP